MASRGRCILLAGAPEIEQLDWSEAALLSSFTIGSNTSTRDRLLEEPQPTASWQAPKWRAISDAPERTKSHHEQPPQTQFLSFTAHLPSLDIATKQDFLEHSIALIDDLATSQLAPTNFDDKDTTNLTSTTFSFASDTSYLSSISDLSDAAPPASSALPTNLPLTDLKQIPRATHILSIAPQTITLNLLCAVISVSQPRVVTLRRRQSTMEILDLLVGDETRAGFSISFWLPPAESQTSHASKSDGVADLRSVLQSLRAGDVVLVRNVALSVWRGAVYGQSLGRRWARNCTRVERVEDGVERDGERAVPFGIGAKLGRVREWREGFVGRRVVGVGGGKGGWKRKRGVEEELPPDSQ